MKYYKRIKAGALQFVLFIGTVLSVLLLGFVLLHHTHQLFGQKTSKVIDVHRKADMGIQYAIGQDMDDNSSMVLDLGMDDNIEVTVSKSYWGIFEIYRSQARFNKTQFTKIALVGGQLEKDFPALYVEDTDRPMIIAGSAKIVGSALLPKQGIRPGGIGGYFYQYESTVYGRVTQSDKKLPNMDIGFRDNIKRLLMGASPSKDRNELRFRPDLRSINSFESPTQYIHGDGLRFMEGELKGNIMVRSDGPITIGKGCNIKDVVLIAPRIYIEDGFLGRLQAVASEEVHIGKHVNLEYPSALIVDRGDEPFKERRGNPNIVIQEEAVVNGVVAYFGVHDENVLYPQVTIAEGASVRGEVYCEKALELKGDVHGKVATSGFIALEQGNIYQNHLYNGSIEANKLPVEYGGLLMDNGKTVIEWMY